MTPLFHWELKKEQKINWESYVSPIIRRQAKKLHIISVTYKPHFKKKLIAITVWGFSVVKDVHKSFMKSNQKICRYKMQGNQHNMKTSLTSHTKIPLFPIGLLYFEYCLQKLPLLIYDHISAKKEHFCLCWKTVLGLEKRSREQQMQIKEKVITRLITWKAGME